MVDTLDWHWNIESKPLVSYSRNPINVTTLYEAFLQYDDKPMITGVDAVTNTIQNIATTVNSMWLSEKKEIIHVSITVKISLALMSLTINIG